MSDLEEKIIKSLSEGGFPFLVAATAGTTVLGSFDPIDSVADICEKYNMWFHVDVCIIHMSYAKALYTPPTPTRLNCRVRSRRRCVLNWGR